MRGNIKRIDLQLKRKEGESQIGLLQNFGNEIPPGPQELNQTSKDTKSTASTKSEQAVATHEPGANPAIPVQDYRDSPIEVKSTNPNKPRSGRKNERKQAAGKQRQGSRLRLHAGPGNTNKKTAADPDLIELNCCLEENNSSIFPNDYKTVPKKLTHHRSIKLGCGGPFVSKEDKEFGKSQNINCEYGTANLHNGTALVK